MALFSSCSILVWKQSSFPWFPLNLLPQSIYVQSRLCWRCGQDRDLHHRNTCNLKTNIRPCSSLESLGHPKTEDFSPGYPLGVGDSLPWGNPTLASSYTLFIMDRQWHSSSLSTLPQSYIIADGHSKCLLNKAPSTAGLEWLRRPGRGSEIPVPTPSLDPFVRRKEQYRDLCVHWQRRCCLPLAPTLKREKLLASVVVLNNLLSVKYRHTCFMSTLTWMPGPIPHHQLTGMILCLSSFYWWGNWDGNGEQIPFSFSVKLHLSDLMPFTGKAFCLK